MKEFLNDSRGSRMTGTRWRLTRRTTYVVTIVAMLAVAGGFAVATAFYASLTMGPTGFGGAQGSATAGSTIYSASGSSSSASFAVNAPSSAGCTSTATSTPASGSTSTVTSTATAWVAGASGATCPTTSDYYDELTFTSAGQSVAASTTATFTDKFTVTLGIGTTSTTYYSSTVTVTCSYDNTAASSATLTCVADINADTGVANSASQPTISSIQVTVTGS